MQTHIINGDKAHVYYDQEALDDLLEKSDD